ncbi:MAG: biotin/lipoate A/B protein ligase family protein [bacterium]
MQESWRFIDSGAHDGSFNMAADAYLTHAASSRTPVLRVYAWQPYAISVGHHQNVGDIDLGKCRRQGVDVVRRPTGGRAIFHAHEVTYAVIIPRDHFLYRQNTLGIYNSISQALTNGLRGLAPGLALGPLDKVNGKLKYHEKFACFASSARYEIHYESRKLVGSAQRRFENAVLQHGSILLGDQHLELMDYLSSANGALKHAKHRLAQKTVSLGTALKRLVTYDEVVQCLQYGFEESYGAKLHPEPLTSSEYRAINKLKSDYREGVSTLPLEDRGESSTHQEGDRVGVQLIKTQS